MNGASLIRSFLFTLFLVAVAVTTASAQGRFVYTNNNNPDPPNTVTAFSVAANGALVPVSGSPFVTGGRGALGGFQGANRSTICKAGSRFYVANEGSNDISGFNIDIVTGALTLVPGSPFATGGIAVGFGASLDCTPDGHFLISTSGVTRTVLVFSIAANGSLTLVAGPLLAGSSPAGIKISPNGRFLYLAEPIVNQIEAFSISAGGALSPVSGSPFQVGTPATALGAVSGIEINCASTFLFSAETRGIPGTIVSVFVIGSNGALTSVPGSPFVFSSGANSSVGLLSPDERFLFVSNQNSNTMTVLAVAPNGALSLVPGSPFSNPGGSMPQQLAANEAGTFLYANNSNGTVSVFSISGIGTLTSVLNSPFFAGSFPTPGIVAFPPKTCGSVFDLCLQDESNGNLIQVNSTTGAYQFTNCQGVTIGGIGTITTKGCLVTLQVNGPDRRVLARIDTCMKSGIASVQVLSPSRTFSILDRNTSNNSCVCPGG